MYRKRKLILDASLEEVQHKLRCQMRRSYITDKVEEDSFLIHKSITNSPSERNKTVFRISGKLRAIDQQIELEYQIKPPFKFLSICLLFIFCIFQVFAEFFLVVGNTVFYSITALCALVAIGVMVWEYKECVRIFESKLK